MKIHEYITGFCTMRAVSLNDETNIETLDRAICSLEELMEELENKERKQFETLAPKITEHLKNNYGAK